ncbi:MAG: hypothetical protein ACOX4N_06640 [Dethiobacteraceae bacterium]
MKNLQFRGFCLIILLMIIATTISACGQPRPISESSLDLNISFSDDVVFGAGSFGFTYSVCEHGLFYHKDNKLQYYDFAAKEKYILCDKANCSHANASCSAWYENVHDATGLAMYGEKVYVIKLNSNSNKYELLSMDPTGNNQKVIYSLEIGDYRAGSWVLDSIRYVYYAGGMAWLSADYQYIGEPAEESSDFSDSAHTLIIGINLQDGTSITLNELSEAKAAYQLELVAKDYIVLRKDWQALEQLSQKAFAEAYEQGEFAEFSSAADPYYEYQVWYQDHSEPMYLYLIYDLRTGEVTEFERGKYKLNYDEDGHVGGVLPKYIFTGTYDGKLIYTVSDYEKNNSLYTLDVKNNEREQLLAIENGGTLVTAMLGGVISSIIDGNKILYCLYTEQEKADILYYDLQTKEHVALFQDDRRITFRLIGETSTKLIGIIYNPITYNPTVYSIDKEDYYQGNLNAAEKLRL